MSGYEELSPSAAHADSSFEDGWAASPCWQMHEECTIATETILAAASFLRHVINVTVRESHGLRMPVPDPSRRILFPCSP